MTQPGALRSSFDQPRDISYDEALLRRHTHHPKIGMQRGERVVCNLRPGVGHSGNESGLARIGHAQQAHIGQHLEFEFEVLSITGPARRFLPGRAVDGTFKAHVAKTAIAALGDGDDLARMQQFIQHLTRLDIADDRTNGHLERDIAARCTKHVRPHAVLATLGFMAARIPEIHQRIQVGICHCEHMPAPTPIPAVGPTEFLVFFMPERHATIAAITGSNVYVGFVDELHGASSLQNSGPWHRPSQIKHKAPMVRGCARICTEKASVRYPPPHRMGEGRKKRSPDAAGLRGANETKAPQAADVTLTVCLDIAPLIANDTWPSTSAYRV